MRLLDFGMLLFAGLLVFVMIITGVVAWIAFTKLVLTLTWAAAGLAVEIVLGLLLVVCLRVSKKVVESQGPPGLE